jgi:uncharacterized membrane protein YtjA (UPF0391 family)
MLRASILFLIAGLISLYFGLEGFANVTFEAGQALLNGFLAISILTFLVSLWLTRRRLLKP